MYCKDIEREIGMKKVILSLAIAGLSISGDCYAGHNLLEKQFDNRDVVKIEVPVQKDNALAEERKLSDWEHIKKSVHDNHPKLEKALHRTKVICELAALGIVVGTVAYYTSPSFHSVVDYAWAFPGVAVNYVKSRPSAVVDYLNSVSNPVAKLGWGALKVGHRIMAGIDWVVRYPLMDC